MPCVPLADGVDDEEGEADNACREEDEQTVGRNQDRLGFFLQNESFVGFLDNIDLGFFFEIFTDSAHFYSFEKAVR